MNNQLWASAGRSRPKKLLTVLMCLLLTVMMMPAAAAAQLQDEEGGSKTLQLIFKDGELALSGVRFDFYQISGKTSETESEAQDAQSGSQDHAEEAAAAFVQAQGIQPVFTGTTDENGQLLVPDLKAGSYLISGEEKTLDHVKYVPQKSVVSLEAAGTDDDAGGPDPVVVSVKFTKEATQQAAAPDAEKSGDNDPAEKNRSDNSGESGADADSSTTDNPDDQPAEVTKMDSSDASAEKVTIAVDKIWVHDGNSASVKPDQATVNLKGSDGTELKQTISGNGSCSFENLPVKDKDGKTITYTITETAVADYATAMASGSKTTSEAIAKAQESAVKANADTVITAVKAATDNQITLTKDQAELLLSATLTMDLSNLSTSQVIAAAKKQNITLTDSQAQALLTAFKSIDTKQMDAAKAAAANASVTITDNGRSAQVDAAKAAELKKAAEITITNTYNKTVSSDTATIIVKKSWLDQITKGNSRSKTVTIRLLKDGQEYSKATLSADTDWTCTFDNLPVEENGKEITYTVKEDAVTNYVTRMIVGKDTVLPTILSDLKQKVKTATNNKVNLTDDQAQLVLSTVLTLDLSSTDTTDPASRTVYVSDTVYRNETNNSRVYHYKKTKAGDNPHEMTEQEAIDLGLRACQDCDSNTATTSDVSKLITLAKQMNITLDTTSATALLKALKEVDLSGLKNTQASIGALSAKNSPAEVQVLNIYSLFANNNGSDKTAPDSKLPQTGILWWPVPVLAVMGFLFLGAGLYLRFRKQKLLPEKDS